MDFLNFVGLRSLLGAMAVTGVMLIGGEALATPPAVLKLSEFEVASVILTSADAALFATSLAEKQKILAPVAIAHLEIPTSLLNIDFADRLDPEVRKSLLFRRNNVEFVRWILNPDDEHYGQQLIRYFEAKGLTLKREYYYVGHRTASRTFLIEDPKSHVIFASKASTNRTPGKWKNKVLTSSEASDARLFADYLYRQNQILPFKEIVIMDEPAAMSIFDSEFAAEFGAINYANIIRDLSALSGEKAKRYYVPLFAIFSQFGEEIAKLNGSDNPREFWTEHGLKVVARGLAELALRTGLQPMSPHSQNFLLELDENFRPNDVLVLRDLPDHFVDSSLLRKITPEAEDILSKIKARGYIKTGTVAGFSPFLGNNWPVWLPLNLHAPWQLQFWKFYEEKIEELLKLSRGSFTIVHEVSKKGPGQNLNEAKFDLASQAGVDAYYAEIRNAGVDREAGLCRELFR